MKSKLLLLEKHISELAINYRADWKEVLWESEKIEEYGLNEFIGGKAEAYEECLELIEKHINDTGSIFTRLAHLSMKLKKSLKIR